MGTIAPQRLVVDCTTGVVTWVDLTPAELAAAEAASAAGLAAHQVEATALAADAVDVNTLRAQYQAMLDTIDADLAKLADAAWIPLTAAQKAETLRTNQQHLLIGMRRILVALGIVVRRTGMPS